MNKEIRQVTDKVKNFNQFINESADKSLRLKDIIFIPLYLEDIFEICRNEIELSGGDLSFIQVYSKIYFDCLMQYNILTYGGVDIISDARNLLTKSNDEREAKLQYKQITKPTHILPADLLKMLSDYKNIYFIDEKLQKYRIIDVMINLVKYLLTDTSHYSDHFKKVLLNSKIKVVGNSFKNNL